MWDIADPKSPKQIAQLSAYGSRVYSVHFLGDNKTLVASGSAKNVRLWDTDPKSAAAEICDSRGTAITEQEWTDQMKGIDVSDPCA